MIFRLDRGFLKRKCIIVGLHGGFPKRNRLFFFFLVKWGIFEEKMHDFQIKWGIVEGKMCDFRVKWGILEEKLRFFLVKWGISEEKMHDFRLDVRFL